MGATLGEKQRRTEAQPNGMLSEAKNLTLPEPISRSLGARPFAESILSGAEGLSVTEKPKEA